MRRTIAAISILLLLPSLLFISCDQMFSNNLFAGLTHQKLSSSTVATMSPAQVEALTESADSMSQLAADPGAKAAALAKLQTAYAAAPASASGQAAAIAAADISIKTVPDAAQFAATAISLVSGNSLSSSASPSTVATALSGILPVDISGQLGNSSTPPAAFTTMIEAFTGANSAYQALAAGVGPSGAYADATLGSGAKMEIAVDAVIAGTLSGVTSPSTGAPLTGDALSSALWSALGNPDQAGSYLSLGSVTGSNGTVSNLLTAAGLGTSL